MCLSQTRSMIHKRTVLLRLQNELVERIEAEADAAGRSITTLTEEVLSQAFDLPQSSPSITTTALQQQLTRLKEEVTGLSEQLVAVQQQLTRLEEQVRGYQNN